MEGFFNERELALRLVFLLCPWPGCPSCPGKNQGISLAPGPVLGGSQWLGKEVVKSPICLNSWQLAAAETASSSEPTLIDIGSKEGVDSQPHCDWELTSIIILWANQLH